MRTFGIKKQTKNVNKFGRWWGHLLFLKRRVNSNNKFIIAKKCTKPHILKNF
jgi:hypothetical protein